MDEESPTPRGSGRAKFGQKGWSDDQMAGNQDSEPDRKMTSQNMMSKRLMQHKLKKQQLQKELRISTPPSRQEQPSQSPSPSKSPSKSAILHQSPERRRRIAEAERKLLERMEREQKRNEEELKKLHQAEPIFELAHKYAEGSDSPAWRKK
jgi:hypothetical protein